MGDANAGSGPSTVRWHGEDAITAELAGDALRPAWPERDRRAADRRAETLLRGLVAGEENALRSVIMLTPGKATAAEVPEAALPPATAARVAGIRERADISAAPRIQPAADEPPPLSAAGHTVVG